MQGYTDARSVSPEGSIGTQDPYKFKEAVSENGVYPQVFRRHSRVLPSFLPIGGPSCGLDMGFPGRPRSRPRKNGAKSCGYSCFCTVPKLRSSTRGQGDGRPETSACPRRLDKRGVDVGHGQPSGDAVKSAQTERW